MKHLSYLLKCLIVCAVITSCTDSKSIEDTPTDEPQTVKPQTFDIRGKVEKGPFISGSEISIQPMNDKLQVFGSMYNTSINDDIGSFQLGSKEFSAPYAEFIATGYFFNEVSGKLSNGTLTLRTLVDLRNNSTINVNILTHLKYARIKKLVNSGTSFSDANSQAQKELLEAFGLSSLKNKDASSFSITAGTDEAAALIVISSILLMDRTEAAFTEYLAKLSEDFGKNGYFSDNLKGQIDNDKTKLAEYLTDIKENIIKRYDDLGISVTVKDLSHYIDWDNDGEAGNETLGENESVKLETSTLNIPNEGGTFTVKIESPITVYLEPQIDEGNHTLQPDNNVSTEQYFGGLYEGDFSDKDITYDAELNANTLNIIVSKLQSRTNKSKTITLYDYVGNVVAELVITQEGKEFQFSGSNIPKLSSNAQALVGTIASSITDGIRDYNLIEQFYNYNKYINSFNSYISPYSNHISNAWSKIYRANAQLLTLKNADEEQLNVYADYCNVLSALCYSNLVYGWGNVPYITKYNELTQSNIPAETAKNILNDLKNKLLKAIDNLEEKKNESLKDINGFFFASKDVARVLLANIYMYENDHNKAMPLLQKVIDNNFYTLDASTNFAPDNTVGNGDINATRSISVTESTEVIFALLYDADAGTRGQTTITIRSAGVLPYITLSDVYLSLAECYCKSGASDQAKQFINDVVKAKSLTISESDVLMQIKEIREQILLYSGTYFTFLKRSGIAKEVCAIDDYQLLFPIPQKEIDINYNLTQNDGY